MVDNDHLIELLKGHLELLVVHCQWDVASLSRQIKGPLRPQCGGLKIGTNSTGDAPETSRYIKAKQSH